MHRLFSSRKWSAVGGRGRRYELIFDEVEGGACDTACAWRERLPQQISLGCSAFTNVAKPSCGGGRCGERWHARREEETGGVGGGGARTRSYIFTR